MPNRFMPDRRPLALSLLAVALAVALALSGCGPDNVPAGYAPGKPKPPAGYHLARAMPIDAALQASARLQLAMAVGSPDEVVRAHALEVMADAAPADARSLVVPRLADSSMLVRKAAAMSAGRLKLSAAHDPLLRMAVYAPPSDPNDPNQQTYAYQVRMAAVFALHELGDTRHSHELELAAVDPRPQIRGDAALIFELIGDTSAKPMLVQMLKHDKSQNVRLQAAEALWKMDDEAGENFLIPATLSGYQSDNMIALLALAGPRDQRALGHIQGFLSYEDNPAVALVAARAAGRLKCDWGVGVAEIAAAKGDPMQRSLAALALGDIGRPDDQPVLRKLLDDQQPDVRVTAAAALLEIGHAR